MDRKEAIDILNDERIVIWTEPHEEEIARKQNEAIDMAIEALQVKTDGDLISRQDAFNLFMQRAKEFKGIKGDLGGACSGAAKLIKKLPSAGAKTF